MTAIINPMMRINMGRLASMLRGQPALAATPIFLCAAYGLAGDTGLYTSSSACLGLVCVAWLPVALSRLKARFTAIGQDGRARIITALDRALLTANAGETLCFILRIDDFEKLRARLDKNGNETALQQLEKRISDVLRPEDRVEIIGEDCLAAALAPAHHYDLETSLQIAARLQARSTDPLNIGCDRVPLSISVGICASAQIETRSGIAVLAAAQAAVDAAQRSGVGSIRVHDATSPVSAPPDTEMIDSALEALETGQIRPWFQPQLCNDTGDVSGFEALARWHHPTKGILGPGDFIPALEAAGRMERLGDVMRRHSLTALKAWDRAGLLIPNVGINVSLAELHNPAFCEKVAWDIDNADLDPGRLTVEILESVVSDGCDDVVSRNLIALSKLGCPIDLDDFGTGHASITSMRRFPVDRIKIDRSFVTHVDQDREQQRMVAAIVTMAERLDLHALAEGVETAAEHAMLAQLGCNHVQGFGIARPMPFEDTQGWVTRHRTKLPRPASLRRNTG